MLSDDKKLKCLAPSSISFPWREGAVPQYKTKHLLYDIRYRIPIIVSIMLNVDM